MQRRKFIGSASIAGIITAMLPGSLVASNQEGSNHLLDAKKPNDRAYWTGMLYRMMNPVFSNLANGTLVKNMPFEVSPSYDGRKNVTYLEAVGRAAAGMAPWLALPDDDTKEGQMRKDLKAKFLKGIANGVDPSNPDYLNFTKEYQPIVDAAYLAHAFLRAPKALWEPLDDTTKKRVVKEFKALRTRKPWNNNWQLFTAITEAFLLEIGEEWDKEAVDRALNKFKDWYVGDGWYSDGPNFSFDYYNSFVIHPMLVDTLKVLSDHGKVPVADYELALKRMLRYVVHLERMISPEGTYPVIGRSITYRNGAFQALAQVALIKKLPEDISPAQVRSALTAVKKNIFQKGTFDKNDWLTLGFCGHHPDVADYYSSTGSMYMASLSFLPLGLPADDEFWTSDPEEWTSKKAWSGKSFKKDYHVDY
ncbi:hypothetical protein SAMN04487906_1389 [Zhouia amylolytica]|uniref:DUF2264 domain-containing protein n=1 Tax=Zhouia amylolytica TaxID=376730 RepID=A0A1I6RVD4_9FLAO|nr:DUF2264 domain-containing protein [Zhouia amylolytica]SFS68669.1 hypothetical protein SAMN04487906_1389 [Zhouia amylolytica]